MTSAEAAKDYYTGSLARADYYTSGQEVVGTWRGSGASRLGLAGAVVTQQTFASLVDNYDPSHPSRRLTARTRSDRRVGYDLSFNAPKGLSLLAALTGDTRIYVAFQQAVTETMLELERAMQVRIRTGGDDENRNSGNLVYGEFLHSTSRPVGNDAPDPHLHIHCCVMNASFDPIENRWKAGQFGAIARDINYYEAAFHTRLASAIVDLGYRTKRRYKFWDVAALPDSLIAKFAKRTDEIEEAAQERGITDAKAKSRLGAQTRTAKRRGLTSEELKKAWWSQLTEAEAAAIHAARLRAVTPPAIRQISSAKGHARASVDYALEHLFERKSVASDKQIAEAALRHGLGQNVGVEDVWSEMDRRSAGGQLYYRQVEDQQLCTTEEAYNETTRYIDFARDGMGRCRALAPNWKICRDELLTPTSADQRAAIQHVLSSTDRVIGVRGRAGTGKTFATQEIAAALAVSGQRLQALAPTSKAVNVLRKEGFASADTISQLLVNPQLQQSIADGVLLIDEAGLLSSRQLDRLFRIAADQNCRVLLQYDLSQHRSVERGSPVRDLERYAGLQPAEIHVVRRQKTEDYKAVVDNLVQRKIDKAFARLAAMDAFVEVADPEERQQRLASDYLKAVRKPGAKVLVVSPTHQEGNAVTKAIRAKLRQAGRIKADEHETLSLQRLGFTVAQRGESTSYAPGQVIQFTQNTVGHQRGDRLVVKERLPDGTILAQRSAPSGLSAGVTFPLRLADKDSFDVYQPRRIWLSVGDRIRITQNGYVPILSADGANRSHDGEQDQPGESKARTHRGKKKPAQRRLINNSTYRIARFAKGGDMVLNNGWVLPCSYGHLTYGYCTTSHASQGDTTDTVLVSQSAESFGASSHEQFYVSCSRGKRAIKIYTDSVAELARAVARSDQQLSAADLLATSSTPQQLPSQSSSTKSKRQRSNRIRRDECVAAACVLGTFEGLPIKTENGISVIASPKRAQLQIGMGRIQPVIVAKNQALHVSLVFEQGRWVCGPRSPVELAHSHILESDKSSTPRAFESGTVSPAPPAAPSSVAFLHSDPGHHSQTSSI